VRYGLPAAAWPPFDLFAASGEHQGVTADYLRLVQQRLGFPLEIVSVATFNDALAALRERRIDVMGSIAFTEAREQFALFSPPYVKSAPVIIARKDEAHIKSLEDLADKTVAVEKGFTGEENLPRRFPGIRLLLFESTSEALSAVSTGKADAYVGGLISSAYLIDKGYLTNLEVRARAFRRPRFASRSGRTCQSWHACSTTPSPTSPRRNTRRSATNGCACKAASSSTGASCCATSCRSAPRS
jgi:ABC-type amino acid transport substrate-binding protein